MFKIWDIFYNKLYFEPFYNFISNLSAVFLCLHCAIYSLMFSKKKNTEAFQEQPDLCSQITLLRNGLYLVVGQKLHSIYFWDVIVKGYDYKIRPSLK